MRDVFKGALAGLAGGIAGSAAKAYAEKLIPPRTEGQAPPPVVLVERTVEHPLDGKEKMVAAQGLHWVFGAFIGAIYGVVVEFRPKAKAANGIAFGLLLNQLTHEGILPAYGLAATVPEQPRKEKLSERTTHAIYGAVTELVRSGVRRRL